MSTTYPEQYANNATTTVSSTVASTDTVVNVTSISGFPSAPQFRILIDSEVMVVTGVSGSQFAVLRGQESTSAASHLVGATVANVLTTGSLPRVSEFNTPLGHFNAGTKSCSILRDAPFNSTTNTVLTLASPSGGPGFIDSIVFNMSNFLPGIMYSVLEFYKDGESSPSFSCPIGGLAAFVFLGAVPQGSRYFDYDTNNNLSLKLTYLFPFNSSGILKLVYPTGQTSGWNVTSAVTWCQGSQIRFGRRARLCASYVTNTSLGAYNTITPLNVSGRGELIGLYTNFVNPTDNNSNGWGGPLSFAFDGATTPQFVTTIDQYYGLATIGGGVNIGTTWGEQRDFGLVSLGQNAIITSYNNSNTAYRIHHDDPVQFTTGLNITLGNGTSTIATVTNPAQVQTVAVYYLDQ